MAYLLAAGEIVLFDRSWYNRAGVERVMGFASMDEVEEFYRSCPEFERMLVRSGIILVKYWFSVSDEEQERRFRSRLEDPLRQWKFSPNDLLTREKWVEFSRAKDEMFVHTDIPEAPWYVVEADIKRHARLNMIAHLLSVLPYEHVAVPQIVLPPRPPAQDYERPPRELFHQVPDYVANLLADGGSRQAIKPGRHGAKADRPGGKAERPGGKAGRGDKAPEAADGKGSRRAAAKSH